MRGEEKPYEMPVAETQPEPMSPPQAPQAANPGLTKQKQHQLSRQHNNNLAIQQRLQHLSPVHPHKLKTEGASTEATHSVNAPPLGCAIVLNPTSPSAASMSSSSLTPPPPTLTSSSTPPSSGLGVGVVLTHPLDSLLTPAASPEEDSLETWIQTV